MARLAMPCSLPAAIIDDDARVRDSLRMLLATADIEVVAFASAEEFLDAQRRTAWGCLLLDVRLPGMSGIELLERLQQAGGGPAIVVITGHGDVPMAVSAMRAGAFHFVEKPFDPEALLAIVQDALARVDRFVDEQSRVQALAEHHRTLTAREQQVLDLLVEGLPSKLIAHELGISTRTAEHHRSAVMRKMKARTLSHLVRMALDLQRAAPRGKRSHSSSSG
jgi:FixJ family two-component response regulator